MEKQVQNEQDKTVIEELGTVEVLTQLGNGHPDWEEDGNYADPDGIIWGAAC